MTIRRKIRRFFRGIRRHIDGLYEERRLSVPHEGNRTAFNVALLSSMLGFLLLFLLVVSNTKINIPEYLRDRSRVVVLDQAPLSWSYLEIDFPASTRPIEPVKARKLALAPWEEVRDLNDLPQPTRDKRLGIRTFVGREQLRDLTEYMTIVLSLPGFAYYRADVFINGEPHRSFFLNRRIAAVLEPQASADKSFTVDVWLAPAAEQESYWRAPGLDEEPFLATQAEYEAFENYLAVSVAGKGAWLGVITKIVLAIFVLLLFLIIDGSPESLGLALAMGFEACVIVLRNGWVSVDLLGNRFDLAFSEGLSQMSNVFYLYFVCQLTRVAPKAIVPWVVAGLAAGVLCGGLRYQNAVMITDRELAFFGYWQFAMKALPLAVTLIGFFHILDKKVPWRVVALSLAAAASLFNFASAALNLLNAELRSETLVYLVNIVQPNTTFLFVLSTFFNISTMEQRIRNQSRALADAKEIEHELEIGRKVQQSIHRVPKLPDVIDFAYFHEAKSYVSGDTFYVVADRKNHRVAMLLTDITGHGIQAALKASACSALAMSVWGDPDVAGDEIEDTNKLRLYHRKVKQYLAAHSEAGDLAAICSVELDYETGELACFRANYLNPIIIEPNRLEATQRAATGEAGQGLPGERRGKRIVYADGDVAPEYRTGEAVRDGGDRSTGRAGDAWLVRTTAIPNETDFKTRIEPGSFILLASDGLISSSSTTMHTIRHLRLTLNRESEELSVHRLRAILLELPFFRDADVKDDMTFLLFQWRGPSRTKAQSTPPQSVKTLMQAS